MFFLTKDTEVVLKAMQVAAKLTDWIEERYTSVAAVPNVHASEYTLALLVDDVCVWNNEDNDEQELNFGFCLDAYKQHIEALAEIFHDKPDEAPVEEARQEAGD